MGTMLASVPNFKHLLTALFLIQLQTKWSLGFHALIWLQTILSSLLFKQLSIKVCFVLSSVWLCNLHPHCGKECWLGTNWWRAYLDLRLLRQHRTEEIVCNGNHYKMLMKEYVHAESCEVLLY